MGLKQFYPILCFISDVCWNETADRIGSLVLFQFYFTMCDGLQGEFNPFDPLPRQLALWLAYSVNKTRTRNKTKPKQPSAILADCGTMTLCTLLCTLQASHHYSFCFEANSYRNPVFHTYPYSTWNFGIIPLEHIGDSSSRQQRLPL